MFGCSAYTFPSAKKKIDLILKYKMEEKGVLEYKSHYVFYLLIVFFLKNKVGAKK